MNIPWIWRENHLFLETPYNGDGKIRPLMTGILIMGPYKPLRNKVVFPIPPNPWGRVGFSPGHAKNVVLGL